MIKQLKMSGIAPVFLDGDQIRRSLKQLDFSEAARKAHNLRVGQMASALEKRGKVVIVSLISPYAISGPKYEAFAKPSLKYTCRHPLSFAYTAIQKVCTKKQYQAKYNILPALRLRIIRLQIQK
jgi:hypothetical protein